MMCPNYFNITSQLCMYVYSFFPHPSTSSYPAGPTSVFLPSPSAFRFQFVFLYWHWCVSLSLALLLSSLPTPHTTCYLATWWQWVVADFSLVKSMVLLSGKDNGIDIDAYVLASSSSSMFSLHASLWICSTSSARCLDSACAVPSLIIPSYQTTEGFITG